MCEITNKNFNSLYNQIKHDIESSKFIAIDTEFSGLSINNDTSTTSLFDNPEERYAKLLNLATQIIPVQVGVTPFFYNPNENEYLGKVYTFYIFPRAFFKINTSFLCQSSSLQFLHDHHFDFNKFVYEGIPFLNQEQELELKTMLSSNETLYDNKHYENILMEYKDIINEWFYNSKNGDIYELQNVLQKLSSNYEAIYMFHTSLRDKYSQKLWTYEKNGSIFIKRVPPNEYLSLCRQYSLEEKIQEDLLGFTKIFRLICNSNKPLVGHNLLTDLILMLNTFDLPLTSSYKKFKEHLTKLLPNIYDTKTLSFELQQKLPKEKMWQYGSLQNLYEYFKDGYGRHLSPNSPLIQPHRLDSKDKFHDAGWDSYFTGYIFIRMAHIFVANSNKNVKRRFMSTELLNGIKPLKNQINVIRCSVPYIKLDGNDPPSTRPPFLIIESNTNEPIHLGKVQAILSSCGFVEIKALSNKGKRAIIAVDNYYSEKRILNQFKTNAKFRIERYNILKHSQRTKSSVIASATAMLFWYSIKKY